uniref:H15 domain-containing protein n=1 Tax=Cyanoderma ruficeps TaxID=181631 RepID=A0A8C3QP47_9PASS
PHLILLQTLCLGVPFLPPAPHKALAKAKAAGTAQRHQAQHPSTLHMVKEALQAHDEKKGASVVAIKRFILAKYPTVDPIRLKYQLKQALSKGLSCGDLVRPHNSSAVGATGTFKVSKGSRKKPQQKLSQADPDRGQAPKPAQKGNTKASQAPVSKGKAPKGAQQGAPKAQGSQDQAKKPRVTPGAGQGKARVKKAAPMAAHRKAP